ncbi:toxic anion resistance protein [Chitinimonas sp.]|uniref:toxic anion resistance protein n=1 Tax=Chitinimonas sp. TaxID=1934313 RepID=UPI002F921A00
MVKTFHHLEATPPPADAAEAGAEERIKTFHHLPQRDVSPHGAAAPPAPIHTFHGLTAAPAAMPSPLPQVLFAGRAVTAEEVDAAWRATVTSALAECACTDWALDERGVQRVRNLFEEIRFGDAQYQSLYAAEVTELMRLLQDQLAALLADAALPQLHRTASAVLVTAKQVNMLALDPNSLSARISDWWRGREARKRLLWQQFEAASAQMVSQLAEVRPVLDTLKHGLSDFSELFARNERLFEQLTVHVLAIHLKLREVLERDLPMREAQLRQDGIQDPFAWQQLNALQDDAERWQRKLGNLQLLRHTALLTLPQLRLSQRNLLAMVGRFDDISEIVIPSWKQQFITAFALPDNDENRLYRDLTSLQAGLREQLERLIP